MSRQASVSSVDESARMNPDDPWAPKRKSSRLEKAVSVAESQSVPKKESDPSLKNAYAELLPPSFCG